VSSAVQLDKYQVQQLLMHITMLWGGYVTIGDDEACTGSLKNG